MDQHGAASPRARAEGHESLDRRTALRRLPSVDDLLRSAVATSLLARHPRWAVAAAARAAIAEQRAMLSAPTPGPRPVHASEDLDAGGDGTLERPDAEPPPTPPFAALAATLAARVDALVRPSLRRAINATGVVLHTNLGRAPLAARAVQRVSEIAAGYSTLELDPTRRERGSRHAHVAALLAELTGAEAAAVVNNNAGAVLVALAALGAGREVVVSRGELVEIGGGFRVPDVMRASGATLVEVGTTNKTRLADYQGATGERTALYLKVHRSNFAIVGFTEDTSIRALSGAAAGRGLAVMVDLGSGALIDTASLGLPAEPTVASVLREGADLCTFSGDKLLGGPQAGIIVGRREIVARVLEHPLMRALRPDKLTLAALEATLEIYRDGTAAQEIPALRMLAATTETLAARKDRLLAALGVLAPAVHPTARRDRSAVGGGALPLAEPETWVVALAAMGPGGVEALADALSAGEPTVVARIGGDRVLLDVRTVADDEIDALAGAVARAVSAEAAS
jgi:L-seryl-tRNA(Ser) seleniumtransferase